MSLRTAVAAPFKWAGSRQLEESEFVVALSLDRDWFSPDQAKRLVDVAVDHGLLERTASGLSVTFDIDSVEIPDAFTPEESVLSGESVFEQLLDAIVSSGVEKRTAVAEINRVQRELAITIEAAAVVYAKREAIDVTDHVEAVRRSIRREGAP